MFQDTETATASNTTWETDSPDQPDSTIRLYAPTAFAIHASHPMVDVGLWMTHVCGGVSSHIMLTLGNRWVQINPATTHTSPSRRVTVVHSYLASRIAPPYHLILLSGASREKQRKKEEKGAALDGGYCAGQLGTINRNISRRRFCGVLYCFTTVRCETRNAYTADFCPQKYLAKTGGGTRSTATGFRTTPLSCSVELHIV